MKDEYSSLNCATGDKTNFPYLLIENRREVPKEITGMKSLSVSANLISEFDDM